MDVHVRRAITVGLRFRGVDVVTAQEDESHLLSDPDLLDRAAQLDRILFSHDTDLLREATFRQANAIQFNGLVFAHQLGITIGDCIRDLELIAKVFEADECRNRIEY